jgi:hypothetical protein
MACICGGDGQSPEHVKLNPNQVASTLIHEGAQVLRATRQVSIAVQGASTLRLVSTTAFAFKSFSASQII